MGERYYNTVIGKYVDVDTGSVSADQKDNGEYLDASQARNKNKNTNANAKVDDSDKPAKSNTPVTDSSAPTGDNNPKTTGTTTYVLRNGQRVPAQIINGQTYDTNGNLFSFQNGDYVATKNGYYGWNNGKATNTLTNDQKEQILSWLNDTNGYTPKGNSQQLAANAELEGYLKANDPEGWSKYLDNGLNYNIASAFGDTAGMKNAHSGEERLRKTMGYSGGVDGTLVEVVDPTAIPEELIDIMQPFIDEYNANLLANGEMPLTTDQFMSMLMNGYPVYNSPQLASAPEAELTLAKLQDFPDFVAAKLTNAPNKELVMANLAAFPDFVRAVYQTAPQSNLSLQFSMAYPEYTVGEGLDKLNPLNYEAQYMPEYWDRFQNEYDPEKYASDYDAIRDQLIEANNAGVDLGRLQLQAQLENALPQYDELRRQNALAQSKAANNTALYNAAQGDLGGIGSRRYSLEQNAYDQRMNEIQLEQQNLINTTNQQIAQLEAEGKMKEAQLLAEWGQAKLQAMQEQYNLYWQMYQQGASAMENLEYGIASDEWDRKYKIRQSELEEQLNKYKADVDAYNAGLNLAKAQLDVDKYNQDYNYQIVRDQNDYNMKMAQLENEYNINKANYGLEQAQLQFNIDKANLENAYNIWQYTNQFNQNQAAQRNDYNRNKAEYGLDVAKTKADIDKFNANYNFEKWLQEANLERQLNLDEYDRLVNRFNTEQDLKQRAFDNAWTKLQNGFITADDIKSLGVNPEYAQEYADYINSLRKSDLKNAELELQYLQKQIDYYGVSKSGGGGSRGGGGGGGNQQTGDVYDRLYASGVTPERAYAWLIDAGYAQGAAKEIAEAYYDFYTEYQLADGSIKEYEVKDYPNNIAGIGEKVNDILNSERLYVRNYGYVTPQEWGELVDSGKVQARFNSDGTIYYDYVFGNSGGFNR